MDATYIVTNLKVWEGDKIFDWSEAEVKYSVPFPNLNAGGHNIWPPFIYIQNKSNVVIFFNDLRYFYIHRGWQDIGPGFFFCHHPHKEYNISHCLQFLQMIKVGKMNKISIYLYLLEIYLTPLPTGSEIPVCKWGWAQNAH